MRIAKVARSKPMVFIRRAPCPPAHVLNPLPLRGWAKVPAPRYRAFEVAGEAGVYTCAARGVGTWSVHQLLLWAEEIGAEVALVRPADQADQIGPVAAQ